MSYDKESIDFCIQVLSKNLNEKYNLNDNDMLEIISKFKDNLLIEKKLRMRSQTS